MKELKKYYKEIKGNLIFSLPTKWIFMHEFKTKIKNFLIEHPTSSIDDIKNHFGSPKEITRTYSNEDVQKLKKKTKRCIIISSILIFLFIVSSCIIIYLYDIIANFSGEVVVTIR